MRFGQKAWLIIRQFKIKYLPKIQKLSKINISLVILNYIVKFTFQTKNPIALNKKLNFLETN